MTQQPDPPLTRIERQLDRLEERIHQELAELRKEVVTRDLLESQLGSIRAQIARTEKDRIDDKEAFEKRLQEAENEMVSRADRLWSRLSPAIAALAFLLALFEFLTHVHFTP